MLIYIRYLLEIGKKQPQPDYVPMKKKGANHNAEDLEEVAGSDNHSNYSFYLSS
jgi:hypothetical protein